MGKVEVQKELFKIKQLALKLELLWVWFPPNTDHTAYSREWGPASLTLSFFLKPARHISAPRWAQPPKSRYLCPSQSDLSPLSSRPGVPATCSVALPSDGLSCFQSSVSENKTHLHSGSMPSGSPRLIGPPPILGSLSLLFCLGDLEINVPAAASYSSPENNPLSW